LVLSLLGMMVMAERPGRAPADTLAQAGARVPRSPAECDAARRAATTTAVFPLTLMPVGGRRLVAGAAGLTLLVRALEVLSLPLYILVGLARRRRLLSQEASLKYFLLGSFSSAFYLFGAVLLYGYAGSMRFDQIAVAISSNVGMGGLLVPGVLLVAVGLLFKVGAVPLHA